MVTVWFLTTTFFKMHVKSDKEQLKMEVNTFLIQLLVCVVFSSDNSLKELSKLSCEEESCPRSSFASRVTGVTVTVEIRNVPLPTVQLMA